MTINSDLLMTINTTFNIHLPAIWNIIKPYQ